MPVYLIEGPDERRLVNAKTKTKAVSHVVRGRFTASSITTSEMVSLLEEGLSVESALEDDDNGSDDPVVESSSPNQVPSHDAQNFEGGQ